MSKDDGGLGLRSVGALQWVKAVSAIERRQKLDLLDDFPLLTLGLASEAALQGWRPLGLASRHTPAY